jgi:hypothetical protein
MIVSINKVTGTTSLTLHEDELTILRESVWDENLKYERLLRSGQFNDERQAREWREKLKKIKDMENVLGETLRKVLNGLN